MRWLVGFTTADEVARWKWGRVDPFLRDLEFEEFEEYLYGRLEDDELVQEVLWRVRYMVREIGYVPRPDEIVKHYERLAKSLLEKKVDKLLERRTGVKGWAEFIEKWNENQARAWSFAASLYWDWRDGNEHF